MGALEIRSSRMNCPGLGSRLAALRFRSVSMVSIIEPSIIGRTLLVLCLLAVLSYGNGASAAPVPESQAPAYRIWYSANDGGLWRILSTVLKEEKKIGERKLAIDLGGAGSLDSANAFGQTVLKSEQGWIMWYSGYDGLNWRILRAVSSDGLNWEKQGLALGLGSAGEFDSVSMTYPFVLKDNDLYKMWYSAYDGKSHWRIGYADSLDGIIFKNRKAVLDIGTVNGLDCEHVYTPVVLKQGAVYTMYYAGYGGFPRAWRILRASSTDALNWSKQGLALDLGPSGDFDSANLLPGSVLFSDGIFKMWYWAHGSNWRVLYAVSKNGIDWEKKGLVLDLGPGRSLDCRGLAVPAVVEER